MSQLSIKHSQKQSTQLAMKMWLPILQAPLGDLCENLSQLALSNPYMEVKNPLDLTCPLEQKPKKNVSDPQHSRSGFDGAQFLADEGGSLYDILEEQINSQLFPTPLSRKAALEIAKLINELGYFDGSVEEIAERLGMDSSDVEKIRMRFERLDPPGVGAKDMKESLLFQLWGFELDDELYELCKKMIEQLQRLELFDTHQRYGEARAILRRMKTPPAIDFMENSQSIIPDLLVMFENDDLKVQINNLYYPDIVIQDAAERSSFAKERLREAKEAMNLLGLRKATVYGVGLLIVQKQFRFFCGGALVPLRLQDIADEMGYNQSTISRAVAGKYLACDRGIFALKEFFTHAVDGKATSIEIKEFLSQTINSEDKSAPYGDEELLSLVQKKFGVQMVRRSITKYRIELEIPSSKERKRT